MLVEVDCIPPNHHRSVHRVAVAQIALSQHMRLSPRVCVLNQTVPTVFKFFFFWQLQVKQVSALFELHLDVAVANRIETPLQQALCPLTINFVDQEGFPLEVVILPGRCAPVFPRPKLVIRLLSPLLLACMLEPKEHSLLKPSFSHDC